MEGHQLCTFCTFLNWYVTSQWVLRYWRKKTNAISNWKKYTLQFWQIYFSQIGMRCFAVSTGVGICCQLASYKLQLATLRSNCCWNKHFEEIQNIHFEEILKQTFWRNTQKIDFKIRVSHLKLLLKQTFWKNT